jgi:hypothetical protein
MDKRGRTRMLLVLLLVASVWKHSESQYWTAYFRGQKGGQPRISTKETNNKKGAQAGAFRLVRIWDGNDLLPLVRRAGMNPKPFYTRFCQWRGSRLL